MLTRKVTDHLWPDDRFLLLSFHHNYFVFELLMHSTHISIEHKLCCSKNLRNMMSELRIKWSIHYYVLKILYIDFIDILRMMKDTIHNHKIHFKVNFLTYNVYPKCKKGTHKFCCVPILLVYSCWNFCAGVRSIVWCCRFNSKTTIIHTLF